MNKTVRNSLIVIGIVIAIFIITWIIYDIFKKEPVDANIINTNLTDENTGLDNFINELFDNVIVNETAENVIANTENNENIEKKEEIDNAGNVSITSKEERAIELVEKEWGGSDGVYFSNESIDNQGRYIVSVRDKRTTDSLAFFVVDIDKELVTKR